MALTYQTFATTDGLKIGGTYASTMQRADGSTDDKFLHTDSIYTTLLEAAANMELKLKESLQLYKEHPDVQANLQQLQYDLQQWNLALTTMTNINKTIGDGLSSVAANFR